MKPTLEISKNIKKTCLELLLEVDIICKKHKLKYFIYGGTLLGAVRHKGFIPWDDDVDLLFLREDYEKFLEICRTELSEKYFLETIDTEALSIITWGKLHKRNTAFIHDNVPRECFQGISIDIFALDKVPSQKLKRKLYGYFHDFINYLYIHRFARRSGEFSLKKRIFYLFIDITKVIPDQKIKRWYKHQCCKYNKIHSKYGIHNSFRKYNKKLIPLQYLEDTCLLEFEGHYFSAPKEWRRLLFEYYGEDFMEIPPKQDRMIHHASIIDPYNSWEKYCKMG